MLDVIAEIGGWSVIDKDFSLSDWNLQDTLGKLQNNYSLGGLFYWIVAENDKNSSEYIIQVSFQKFKLLRSFALVAIMFLKSSRLCHCGY